MQWPNCYISFSAIEVNSAAMMAVVFRLKSDATPSRTAKTTRTRTIASSLRLMKLITGTRSFLQKITQQSKPNATQPFPS